jgi:hypothetical protein
MKKNIFKLTLIIAVVIFAGYSMYQSNFQVEQLVDTTLSDVEALAGCESNDGYDLNKYCNPATGRCYRGDFTANNCISNLV